MKDLLDGLQSQTFSYFIHEVNESNGLVADTTKEGSPASISATGFALTSYAVGVERSLWSRSQAIKRTLATMRFFRDSKQSPEPDATGYKGFYYHFLDRATGRRRRQCEVSTIDTAFLLAGMLCASAYFGEDDSEGREIRDIAEELYARVDWNWARNNSVAVSQGWKPESGFLDSGWQGYDEALVLYQLGLGSPTHPLPEESYRQWTSTFEWKKIYDEEFVYCGPLFTHQISHVWTDFRGIQDQYMRKKGIDYFENSRRATYVQQRYATDNPMAFEGYGPNCWGITACDGPGPDKRNINGHMRQFFSYKARGVPDGPDDGTIAPWSALTSLPFAPEIVLPTLEHFEAMRLRETNPYGFKATFNRTFVDPLSPSGYWISPYHFGLNQGPVLLMIENYRSGLIWRIMRDCPYIVAGLGKAGFTGGWIDSKRPEGIPSKV